MLRTPLVALTVVVASCATASTADAQVVVRGGAPRVVRAYPGTPYAGWYTAPAYGYYAGWSAGPAVAPYSYYAAFPYPARGYVGYGANDFPFYGHPYGHPYDPWSWTTLSGGAYGVLARYYYPPLL
jgi:hypothetical protein